MKLAARAVWQKIVADITGRPLISTLIIVTVAAAATLLTLALATLLNMSAPYDRSFAELNGAHLWLYFERDLIRPRDVRRIEALPAVTASTGVRYSVRTRARLPETRVWTSLRLRPTPPPAVNRLLIQEGRDLAPERMEVLAGKDLHDLYDLSVGDEVEITRADGVRVTLPVVGLAYNPMWDTYRNSQPPYLYVSEKVMRELFPGEAAWDWSMGVRLADPEAVDEVLAQIEALVRPDAVAGHTDWRDVRESAIFGAQLNFVFLGSFSLFAILATTLVVATSISALVLSQFRQIGILKAIGFTRRQVLALYVGQYLLLSLIGSPLGLLVGSLLAPLPLRSVAASLSAPFRPPLNGPLIALVLGSVPAIVIATTLGSAMRGARANIVQAIATGAEPPRRRPGLLVRLATRLNLPMVLVMGLNDALAKPVRSLLTGLNLTLGVIGIVFGLTLNGTLDKYETNPALLGIVYDGIVTRQRTSDRRVKHLLREGPGIEAFYAESRVEAEVPATGQTFQVRAVEGDLEAFPFQITQGRFFRPHTYEAIAGQGLLDWLGLTVGDELTLILEEHDERPLTWRIVGQYNEPVNAGQMLMVSFPCVTRALRHAEPNVYYLKLAPNANVIRLKRYLEPDADADLNLTLTDDHLPGAVLYLQLAIFALAGILIGIALVNVFNTTLLATQEKLRIFGVLKTVGMTPAQVVTMVNATAGFLSLPATLLGIPIGLAFTQLALVSLSRAYGFGVVSVAVNGFLLLALIPLMMGVSMLGSIVPGRWAARVSIVKVLRNE
jgi:putative ABC transport system permease protein